jgi:hypothetical protein
MADEWVNLLNMEKQTITDQSLGTPSLAMDQRGGLLGLVLSCQGCRL